MKYKRELKLAVKRNLGASLGILAGWIVVDCVITKIYPLTISVIASRVGIVLITFLVCTIFSFGYSVLTKEKDNND